MVTREGLESIKRVTREAQARARELQRLTLRAAVHARRTRVATHDLLKREHRRV